MNSLLNPPPQQKHSFKEWKIDRFSLEKSIQRTSVALEDEKENASMADDNTGTGSTEVKANKPAQKDQKLAVNKKSKQIAKNKSANDSRKKSVLASVAATVNKE